MSSPPVTVVIPCHDHGRFLPEAVASVVRQSVTELECLIVDDGSTDDSLAVARRLAAEDARIRVHAQACSGSPGLARNAGIERTTAPYVLCLDADDSLAPGFLERCVEALEADPRAGVAYGDQQNFGGDAAFHAHGEYDFAFEIHQNLIGTASLFRRAAWEAAGGFRAVGYEDWDFWIGCGEQGYHGVHVAGAVFNYRVGESGRYALDQARDAESKAQIVLGHPRLYTTAQRRWALAVEAGEPGALACDRDRERIPSFAPVAPVDARRTIVAADARELLARPELLRRYDRRVGADDDVTLLVHLDPDVSLDELAALADGVDADVLAIPEATQGDVAAAARAVLTDSGAPLLLAGLPRFELDAPLVAA